MTPEARADLLRIARASIERRAVTPPASPELSKISAAFVSIHTKGGDLRGCIGSTRAESPLWKAVRDAATAAATDDPRFPAVEPAEFENLHVEISVLSSMAPIAPDAVVVGTHGLYIRRAGKAGLLLPQVAPAWNWDRETFLSQTCLKAGLPAAAWREPATEILGFTAEVFGEP